MKKFIATLLKIGISLGIIAYLVWKATRTRGADNVDVFTNLVQQPKNLWMLAWALAFTTAGVLLTFIRWWYLVRALGIPCRFSAAIRISFWGYLFNLLPLGIVGGDLIKAVMLAHEHPQYRAKSVASVLFDRIIGLYLLFVVPSVAILLMGYWNYPAADVRTVCRVTILVTLAVTAGIALLYVPGVMDGPMVRALGRLPYCGGMIRSLIDAVGLYRYKPVVLAVSSLMTIGVHICFTIGIYMIARGLPGEVLSLGAHFVVWPLSGAAGALPLSFGPVEWVLDSLYTMVHEGGVIIPAGQGLLVVLCYRLITVIIAAMGVGYYFSNRRELTEAIHEDEQGAQSAVA